jgi:hypothetical protein
MGATPISADADMRRYTLRSWYRRRTSGGRVTCPRVAGSGKVVEYRSADRCLSLHFAATFSVQPAPRTSVSRPGLARGRRGMTGAVL